MGHDRCLKRNQSLSKVERSMDLAYNVRIVVIALVKIRTNFNDSISTLINEMICSPSIISSQKRPFQCRGSLNAQDQDTTLNFVTKPEAMGSLPDPASLSYR